MSVLPLSHDCSREGDDGGLKPGEQRGNGRRYWYYFRSHARSFIFVVLCLVVATYCDSVTPRLYRELTSGMQKGKLDELGATAFQLILYTLGSAAFFLLSSYLTNISGEAISSHLRMDLFEALQRMPFWFFTMNKSGHFVSLFNNQLHGAQNGITRTVPKIITNLLTVVMSAYQLVKSDWKVSGALLVLVPFFVLVTEWLQSKMSVSQKQAHELRSEMNDTLKSALSASSILAQRNFDSNGQKAKKSFEGASNSIQASQERIGFFSDIYSRIIYVLFSSFSTFAYVIVGLALSSQSQAGTVDAGEMIHLITQISRLQAPLVSLGTLRIDLASTTTSFNAIFKHLEDAETYSKSIRRPEKALRLSAWPGDILLDNVTFVYPTFELFKSGGLPKRQRAREESLSTPSSGPDGVPADTPALSDLTMRIESGSKVAIVGSNGSGKTTLAYLLAGLHIPTSGSISVAAHPYTSLEESSFASLVGILDQDPWFEHASIRANLEMAAAAGDLQDSDIQHACSIANILEFIKSLPNGFDTMIGENAMRLSAGQRQRLAIARLILKKPSFIILDEFNSHLDTKTETEVFNLILQHFSACTLVIITHRFSILRRVDKIFHMAQGKLIESGSHAELMDAGSSYAQLYNDYRDSL